MINKQFNIRANRRTVTLAKKKIRAAVLWTLSDEKWRRLDELRDLQNCASEAEVEAWLNCESAADDAESIPSRDHKVIGARHELLYSALSSLVDDGLCQIRGPEDEQEIRLVDYDDHAAAQTHILSQLEKEAIKTLAAWREDGAWGLNGRPSMDLLAEAIETKKPYLRAPLMLALEEYYYSGYGPTSKDSPHIQYLRWVLETRPPRSESAPAPTQPIKSSPDLKTAPAPAQTGQASPENATDALFWYRAGFFGKRQLFYFKCDTANEPTLIMCKALLVEILRDNRQMVPTLDSVADFDARQRLLCSVIPTETSITKSVCQALTEWSRQNGEPAGLSPNCNDSNSWWRWLEPQINWQWIVGRIGHELDAHQHRRMKRALELAVGNHIDHIEARLGDFVGTFEELYLKALGH
jgi:hypothetical protein